MSETIGLIIFTVLLAVMAVLLVGYFRRREKIEIDEAFARARGWNCQDVLPEFGSAQRQRIFSPADPDATPWEMIISLPQGSSTVTVPVPSTVWHTPQVQLEQGMCIVGPLLPQPIDQVDLSSPFLASLVQHFLGDDARYLASLQAVNLPDTARLTVLATDPQCASESLPGYVIDQYDDWLNRFPDTDYFPVLHLDEHRLQFKTRKALTKASEADSFVEFCTGIVAAFEPARR